jgi:hypothetical protein
VIAEIESGMRERGYEPPALEPERVAG